MKPAPAARSALAASSPSSLIALAASALGYLRFAPDADPVSVPTGAHAGQLTLEAVSLRAPRTAATRPTAARSSCPRTGPTRSRG